MRNQTIGTTLSKVVYHRDEFDWRRLIGIQEIGILLIFLLWCAFLSLVTDTFLTSTNIFNMLRAFSWIAIAALASV